MSDRSLVPDGEALRRALTWLAQQDRPVDTALAEEAARRFDLTPRDEAFLLRELVHHRGLGGA